MSCTKEDPCADKVIRRDLCWVAGTDEEFIYNLKYKDENGISQITDITGYTSTLEIRTKATGSIQRRFAITEETAIDGGVDVVAKVIKSRLLNANYCDLDFEETQEGLGYICNYLSTLGMLYDTDDASERLDRLLVDGSNSEKYNTQMY